MGRLLSSLSRSFLFVGSMGLFVGSMGVLVGAGGALAGCSAMHGYDDVARGRSPCDSCASSPWALYGEMSSGRAPCGPSGACACKAKPVCAPGGATASTSERPPNARPGEVWCRVVVPAVYATRMEPVTTVCAEIDRTWVPPVMETRFRRVCVREATECVIETPGATRIDVMCAEGRPARTELREVVEQGPCGCTKRCESVTIPATTCTTRREVCIHAPERRTVWTPAEYVNEPCLVEVTPGRWVETPRPAVVEMRSHLVCTSPERVEWRRNPSCAVPVQPPVPCAPSIRR